MAYGIAVTVAQPAEAVEADRADERVAGLALVEFRRGLPAQLRPVEREQRAFDAADLAQSQRQAVLAR